MGSTLHLAALEELAAHCPERDGVPVFLKIPPNERRQWWVDHPPVPMPEERFQDERRAAIKAAEREKTTARLAALKGAHPGEHYDRKALRWAPDAITAPVTDGADSDHRKAPPTPRGPRPVAETTPKAARAVVGRDRFRASCAKRGAPRGNGKSQAAGAAPSPARTIVGCYACGDTKLIDGLPCWRCT